MIEEIKKEDLPDWEYGDVAVKTFSFGDSTKIASMVAEIKKDPDSKPNEIKPEVSQRSEIDLNNLSMFIMGAGIHWIKNKDGSGFVIPAGTPTSDKMKIAYEFEQTSAHKIMDVINTLNKIVSKETKKK